MAFCDRPELLVSSVMASCTIAGAIRTARVPELRGCVTAEESPANNGQQEHAARFDVKQAVDRARKFLLDVYEGEDLPNLRLEEVELSDDGQYWLVTLGFTGYEEEVEHCPILAPAFATTTKRAKREYKLVPGNAYTGEAESIKIREL